MSTIDHVINEEKMPNLNPYPIFLVGLHHRHCIIIGGGREAEFKTKGLLDVDANITLIAPDLTSQLESWANEGVLTWFQRRYLPGDLKGAFLVIAERNDADPAQNQQIFAEAERENALVTVLDDIPHCNAVAGSVVRQGKLAITISTSGVAPALAVRLRQRFEQEFGTEYKVFLDWMQRLRQPMKQTYTKFSERRGRWYQLIDSDILTLLRAGKEEEASARLTEISGIHLPESAE